MRAHEPSWGVPPPLGCYLTKFLGSAQRNTANLLIYLLLTSLREL